MRLYKTIEKTIVPSIIFQDKKVYSIKSVPDNFVIKKFTIIVDSSNKILEVLLHDSKHPNCNPETGVFCLPKPIRNSFLDEQALEFLEYSLSIYNLDNCYFSVWRYLKWEDFSNELSPN